MASKKKPTKKQLAARAKFTKIMQSGGFKKKKKSTTSKKSKSLKRKADKTIKKFDDTLILRAQNKKELKEIKTLIECIRNPKVKEIVIRK